MTVLLDLMVSVGCVGLAFVNLPGMQKGLWYSWFSFVACLICSVACLVMSVQHYRWMRR